MASEGTPKAPNARTLAERSLQEWQADCARTEHLLDRLLHPDPTRPDFIEPDRRATVERLATVMAPETKPHPNPSTYYHIPQLRR